ncbi:MAG: sugar-binding domain-containing protein [Thermoguttaceae bacterium]
MPIRSALSIAAVVLLFCQPVAAAEVSARGSNSSPRVKQCFDFDWRFTKSDPDGAEAPEFDDGEWRKVDLPHDFSVEGPVNEKNISGVKGGFLPLGVGWYRKEFKLPESFRGKRVILRFDGVMYFADVYVNGRHVGRESNPYLSRDWDITKYVKKDGGKSLGTKRLADFADRMIRWEVPNEPGTIRAVARDEQGKIVAKHELQTAGPPKRLELTSDRKVLAADGQDLAHVRVRVVDRSGNLVPHGGYPIEFALKGEGRIVGVDNGDLFSHESFKKPRRTTYQGRALAIIRAGRHAGMIRLSARAEGLEPAVVKIATKPAQ